MCQGQSKPGLLWQLATLEQRHRVQTLLFEAGLAESADQGILNRSNSSLFSILEAMSDPKVKLASPTGFEPVSPPGTGGVLGH
jgi:hypothetical protein